MCPVRVGVFRIDVDEFRANRAFPFSPSHQPSDFCLFCSPGRVPVGARQLPRSGPAERHNVKAAVLACGLLHRYIYISATGFPRCDQSTDPIQIVCTLSAHVMLKGMQTLNTSTSSSNETIPLMLHFGMHQYPKEACLISSSSYFWVASCLQCIPLSS